MKAFLKEVAEKIFEQYAHRLTDVTIVFNNKRPALYLNRHLSELIGKPFFSPQIITIEEFFSSASPYTTADEFTQFFMLHTAYNELLLAEGDKEISAEAFYNTANVILSDFAQADRDLVNTDKLFAEMKDISEIELQFDTLDKEQKDFLTQFWKTFSADKQHRQQEMFLRLWRRMPLLYKKFHQKLQLSGLTTSAKNYRDVADGIITLPEFKSEILFVGFNALSKAEEKVFLHLHQLGKARFYFDTDTWYMNDDMQEAGLFMRRNIKLGLQNELDNKRSFIADKTNTPFHIHSAEGGTAQVKLLHSLLEPYYSEITSTDNASSVAIVLADETLLLPLLQTIPEKYPAEIGYEIPLNITMGYPFAASALYGIAEIWFRFQQQIADGKKTIYFKDAEQFVSHPFIATQEDETADFLKNILKHQVIDVPIFEIEKLAPSHFFFFKKTENLAAFTHLFRQAMQQVAAGLQQKNALKKTEAEFFVRLFSAINNFETSLQLNKVEMSIGFAIQLLQKAFSQLTVPFSGEPLKGIQIMGLLESRNLDFDHLFIVGANEGLIPKKTSGNTFIPDSIRRAHGLPVLENQNAISAYLFYRLIQRPQSIHLFYNSSVSDKLQGGGEVSRFVRQLEFESPFLFTHLQMQQPVKVQNLVEREIYKSPEILKKLEAFLDREGKHDSKISATAFTSYLNCSMQFFLKYVAVIKEPEEVDEAAEANVIGSALHELMDLFYKPFLHKLVTANQINERKKLLPELARSAYAQAVLSLTSLPQPVSGYRQIVLAIIEEYAAQILEYDALQAPFIIHELENKNDYILKQPIHVNGQTRNIRLFGIIDRVDEVNGEMRIVDYKTGGDKIEYASSAELYDRSMKKSNKALLQTLFYTYIYEQLKKRSVVPELYVLRGMRKNGTRFYNKTIKQTLEGNFLAEEKASFKDFLISTMEEIFDPSITFKNTENLDVCKYCVYGKICGRG